MATMRRASAYRKTLQGSRKNIPPPKKGPAPQRACSFCLKIGHNARSHEPGGKHYVKGAKPRKVPRG